MLEQARSLEGGSAVRQGLPSPASSQPVSSPSLPPTQLNSLFMGLQEAKPPAAKSPKSPKPSPPITAPTVTPVPSKPAPHQIPTPTPAASISEADSLEKVLEHFIANEKLLSDQNGGKELLTDEEGLPIHDIHETESGEVIGVGPEPSQSEEDAAASARRIAAAGQEGGVLSAEEEKAAWARRRAVFERVFGKDDEDLDSSDDEDQGEKEEMVVTGDENDDERTRSSPTEMQSGPLTETTTLRPGPSNSQTIPSTIIASSTSAPAASANPPPTPRSILKPPPPQIRKKSVTFDPTVPLPPDSPDPDPSGSKQMSFSNALTSAACDVGEFETRPVPVIQIPVPGKKAAAPGFGGMRRGFLDPPGSAKPKPKEIEEIGKKKPSLFAQRMAQSVVKESPTPIASSSTAQSTETPSSTSPGASSTKPRPPGLPVMASSATSATNTLRSSVIEKPHPPSSACSSKSSSSGLRRSHSEGDAEEEEDLGFIDDDDYESDDYDDEEDEDEYDLDDALLAREVALEYHRRRAYTSPYTSQDPDDPSYGLLPPEATDSGGVLLAMPQVDSSGSGAPMIINPTPDDFRRFVRVGKLENGNLVLAPGEEGWSDDEEEVEGKGVGELEIERQRKRDNKKKMMDALSGSGNGVVDGKIGERDVIRGKGTIGNTIPAKSKESGRVAAGREVGLPPTVISAPQEPTAPAVGAVMERSREEDKQSASSDPPKKVSRFKAARMGGA